jgi:hypothetical protein
VQRHPEGFQYGSFCRRYRIGQREQMLFRPGHLFPQAPILLAMASEFDVGTEIGVPMPAGAALAAGDGGIDGDSFAPTRPGQDLAGEFMAQH